VKLVVLYTQPGDPDAFDSHYLSTHVPLLRRIPGRQKAESGRIVSAVDGGDLGYFRTAELTFADQAALQAACAPDEGKATAAGYRKLAPEGSRMFVSVGD